MNEWQITDIHSHILPGVDDGAEDWDMSMQMLKRSWEAGVRQVIATPHYLPWRHTIIARQIPELCREAMSRAEKELGISIKIWPGQELYYHRDILQDLEEGKALSLAGSRYVLAEFNEQIAWRELRYAAEQFQRSRWQMIIAHAERFDALRVQENLDEILDMGIQLQSNAEEMNHGFLDGTTRWLRRRYDAREIMYIGSDMHNLTTRPPLESKSLKWIAKLRDEEYRQQLLNGNAGRIFDDAGRSQ